MNLWGLYVQLGDIKKVDIFCANIVTDLRAKISPKEYTELGIVIQSLWGIKKLSQLFDIMVVLGPYIQSYATRTDIGIKTKIHINHMYHQIEEYLDSWISAVCRKYASNTWYIELRRMALYSRDARIIKKVRSLQDMSQYLLNFANIKTKPIENALYMLHAQQYILDIEEIESIKWHQTIAESIDAILSPEMTQPRPTEITPSTMERWVQTSLKDADTELFAEITKRSIEDLQDFYPPDTQQNPNYFSSRLIDYIPYISKTNPLLIATRNFWPMEILRCMPKNPEKHQYIATIRCQRLNPDDKDFTGTYIIDAKSFINWHQYAQILWWYIDGEQVDVSLRGSVGIRFMQLLKPINKEELNRVNTTPQKNIWFWKIKNLFWWKS